jgi:hypothetical protein
MPEGPKKSTEFSEKILCSLTSPSPGLWAAPQVYGEQCTYFRMTVLLAEPPRLPRTVMFCGLVGKNLRMAANGIFVRMKLKWRGSWKMDRLAC